MESIGSLLEHTEKQINFRRRKKASASNQEPVNYIPVLWEDDFCLVEIVPIENQSFIKNQVAALAEFSEKNFDGIGFKNMFTLGAMPEPTVERELRVEAFELTLAGRRLPKANQIQYESEKILDCNTSSTKAYGFPNCIIFFNTFNNGEFVNHIWLDIKPGIPGEQRRILLNVFYDLGESYQLTLIDWNSLELVELRDEVQIDDYLKSFAIENG